MGKSITKQNLLVFANILPWAIYATWVVIWSLTRPDNAPEDWSGAGVILFPVIIGVIYAASACLTGLVIGIAHLFNRKLEFKLILTIIAVPLSLLFIIPYVLAD